MTRVAQMTPQYDPESSVDLLLKMQSGDEQAGNDLLGSPGPGRGSGRHRQKDPPTHSS